jgi:hypothetical protein
MAHRKSDFISLYRMNISKFLDAWAELETLKKEYDALDYGTALDQEDDFVGANADITKADLVDAVGSMTTVGAAITGGFHHTNFYKVRE